MSELEFCPLSAQRWQGLERLFGVRGASGGCWCMWWRFRRSAYERQKGELAETAIKRGR
jgi:hypothetical protein